MYQYCPKMWYLCFLEHADGIQKQKILECQNVLVLPNTCVPVSGTWSTLFPIFLLTVMHRRLSTAVIFVLFLFFKVYIILGAMLDGWIQYLMIFYHILLQITQTYFTITICWPHCLETNFAHVFYIFSSLDFTNLQSSKMTETYSICSPMPLQMS